MGVVAATPVLEKSADTSGVSTMTAARRLGDSRSGSLYEPSTIAAIAPVHCHPLSDGRYLLLFSRRWYNATQASSDPGGYTSYSVDTEPGWVIATVPTGVRSLPGAGYSVSTTLPNDSIKLTGAVSRASDYLFMLYQLTQGSVTTGAVAHWWVNTGTDSVLPLAEETVPGTEDIVFDRGLWYASPWLIVVGAHTGTNEIYLARKPWARIGVNTTNKATLSNLARVDGITPEARWEYATALGWSADITEAAPVLNDVGNALTTKGTVSTVVHRDRTFMSTVTSADDNLYYGAVYLSRGGSAWTPDGQAITVGSVSGGSYLGSGIQFQQQLTAHSSTGEMSDPGNTAALPYVISSKATSGGVDRLENRWSVWPVARGQGTGVTFAAINPSPAVVGLLGSAPRFQRSILISPATLTLTGFPPGNTLTPTAAVLHLTGAVPSVGNLTTVTPAGATGALTGSAPTVRPGTNLRPAGATVSVTGSAPTITVAATGVHISDTFNRANSSSVGSNWTNRLTNPMGILSNQSYVVTDVTDALITHNTVMLTDNHKISVVAAPQAGMLADFVYLIIGAKADGSEYASFIMYASYNPGDGSTNPTISTGNGWAATDTVRSAAATYIGFTTGDVISLERTGNVYTAKKNGTTVVTWTDGSNVLPRDSSHRLVGLYAYRYLSGGTNFYDVRYDSFTADDL